MMVWDLGNTRRIHSYARMVAALFVTLTVACEGCKACKAPAAPDVAVAPSTPDTGAAAEPDVDNSAVAIELAEAASERIGVRVGDSARALSGEIEAATAAKKPKKPTPRLKDEPETGKLQKAELNKVFDIHAEAMKTCYERSLKRSPGLMGKVRLELLIRSSGEVRNANARGISLRDEHVSTCMERQAMTMKFPEPDGGALRVNKTYSFTPAF